MYQKIKPIAHIFFVVLIATIVSGLSLIIINAGNSLTVTAQEPQGQDSSINPFEEKLATFGLSLDSIQASSGPFDLEVVKTTTVSSVTSGSQVTFNILITNMGSNPVSYVFFKDDHPSQMKNAAYVFSTQAISNGQSKPEWLLPGPIPANNGTVTVMVTGILTSGPDVTVKNTAIVTAFNSTEETNTTNNKSTVSVNIVGYSPLQAVYLPVIRRDPPPPRVLLYSDNFSSSGSGWTGYDDSDCERGYKDKEYRMNADADEKCFTPAPSKAEYTYGEFQVSARVSSGDGDLAYGIYINGKGEDNYYLFRIKPDDNCGWRLIRRKGGSNTAWSGGCNSAINRGSTKNVLTIKHAPDGKISIYVNGKLLYSRADSNLLKGKGVGLYVEADDDEDITVRFDDFKIYSVPQ